MRAVMMISSIAMGGAERILVSVLPHFKEQGVDIRLCSLNTRRDSPLIEQFTESGIPRFDLGARRMVDPAAWRRFTTMLRDEKIDIVHAQDQDTNIYAALARRRLGIPSVMTRHVMVEPSEGIKETLRARLVLLAARYGFDRIIAVSEAVREAFSKLAKIDSERIETIYNGIEIERFDTHSARDAKRAEMGWPLDQPTVIMVAVLRPGKGHEVLFDAIPRLKEAVPGVRIKLVGGGELEDELRQQAAPYGETVEFLGQRMDVPDLLGASDVMVLPSWSEALPTVLIEAGAAGLPVVATDVGGSAEIVKDAETGYIVPPGDSAAIADRLIAVLKDPGAAMAMGDRARDFVTATFSLEEQARRTIALYEKVINSR
ncbi:MAG: glycosyltransferase family 4 protein [Chloroflexi bacterium]|nr:glycosyltransferase family 4 protein [Chloroflexota bacterium]